MAAFQKFNQFVEDKNHGVHNLSTNQLVVALCASANAPVATNAVLANLVQVAYTNLSTRNITTTASAQTAGVYKLTLTDLVLTATGGPSSAFRYVVIYNDTPTAPADPLVGFYDYGSEITLADGETLTIDFDDANGVLTDT